MHEISAQIVEASRNGEREDSAGALKPTGQRQGGSGGDSGFLTWVLRQIDVFIPAHFDELARRRGRLLVGCSFAFVLAGGTILASLYFQFAFPAVLVLAALVPLSLFLLNPLLLKRTGSLALAGVLLCLEGMAVIGHQAYLDAGIHDPVLLWLLVFPWLSSFLVSSRGSILFTLLVILELGFFHMLELSGHDFPRLSEPSELQWSFFIQASLVAVVLGWLSWINEGQTVQHLREVNTRLVEANAKLEQSNRRISNILESITNGFFALDKHGRFTYLNRRAERLLRTSREAVEGKRVFEHLPILGDELQAAFVKARGQGNAVELELFYPPLQTWFEFHVYPFEEGYSVYFADTTERKRAEIEVLAGKEAAEEAARMKDALLANMSHELRTPLSGILGFAQIISEEAPPEIKEFADLIEHSGRRLLDTLNSVLDFAHLQDGKLRVQPQLVDLTTEVPQLVRLLDPLASEKGLPLVCTVLAPEARAELDKPFLARIINNLVGNAIKFTQTGRVEVEVDADERHVYLRVRDTGIGISREFLPHLFDEFRQESAGLSRTYEGTGLGLAIVKRLVSMMDGSVSVRSELGAGSLFTVSFPRAD